MGNLKIQEEDDDEVDLREGVFVGAGARVEQMKRRKSPNKGGMLQPSKKAAQLEYKRDEQGLAAELRFQQICDDIIARKKIWWLIKCTHATRNEDKRHQTDFKLLCVHSQLYQFYLKIQVKHSNLNLKPLAPDIDLVIVNATSNIYNVLAHLRNIYNRRSRYPQEVAG